MEKSGIVAIVVALITAAGVLGAKYLEVGAKAGPTPPTAVAPVPSAAPAAQVPVSAPVQEPVTPIATAGPGTGIQTPPPVEDPAPATPKGLTGAWAESATQAIYRIQQNGNAVLINGSFNGLVVMAQGVVDGTGIVWDFAVNNGDRGRCQGQIETPDRLRVMCMNVAGVSYPVEFNRAS